MMSYEYIDVETKAITIEFSLITHAAEDDYRVTNVNMLFEIGPSGGVIPIRLDAQPYRFFELSMK